MIGTVMPISRNRLTSLRVRLDHQGLEQIRRQTFGPGFENHQSIGAGFDLFSQILRARLDQQIQ